MITWLSALPERRRTGLRHGCLGAMLLALLSACGDGGAGSDDSAATPPTSSLGNAANQVRQANSNALGALQQAHQLEQTLQDDVDRRRREMESRGL